MILKYDIIGLVSNVYVSAQTEQVFFIWIRCWVQIRILKNKFNVVHTGSLEPCHLPDVKVAKSLPENHTENAPALAQPCLVSLALCIMKPVPRLTHVYSEGM